MNRLLRSLYPKMRTPSALSALVSSRRNCRRYAVFSIFAIGFLYGCRNDIEAPVEHPLLAQSPPFAEQCDPSSTFAPYGVRLTAEQRRCMRPEPYDPMKHGAPLANSREPHNQAVTNPAGLPRRVGRSRQERESAPEQLPGTGDQGWRVDSRYWGLGHEQSHTHESMNYTYLRPCHKMELIAFWHWQFLGLPRFNPATELGWTLAPPSFSRR